VVNIVPFRGKNKAQVNESDARGVQQFLLDRSETLIILGGGAVGPTDLSDAMQHSDRVIAADGGANALADAQIQPEAIIGDLDSIRADVLARTDPARVFEVTEQDTTDFDKALRHVEAACVLAVGFSGGRVDHQLGVLHTLVARPHQPCVVLAPEDVIFLCPPRISLPTVPGTRVSLFPLGPVTGRSAGLQWPIDGLAFAPGTRSGTSNRAVGPVELSMEAPSMLCMLPRACLGLAVRALVALPQPHGRWPAPAGQCTDPPPS
jgi:thiamine pyrophosphokinase